MVRKFWPLIQMVHAPGLRIALGVVTAEPVVDGADVGVAFPEKKSRGGEYGTFACGTAKGKRTFQIRRRSGLRGCPSCAMALATRATRSLRGRSQRINIRPACGLTLVEVSTSFVICGLPEAAVGRAAVVVDVAETLDDGGEETLVDPAGGEVCVAEVGSLVRVVELEVERLGDLIIWGMISSTPVSGVRDASKSGRALADVSAWTRGVVSV